VAGVTGHYYHCVKTNPGATKRRRKLATRSRADALARGYGGHFPGGGSTADILERASVS
jgi:hypothetical protein